MCYDGERAGMGMHGVQVMKHKQTVGGSKYQTPNTCANTQPPPLSSFRNNEQYSPFTCNDVSLEAR